MRSQKTGTLLRRGALWRFVMTAAEGKNPWMLAAAGLIAGFINGLIGAGGGVFIVRSAAKLLPRDEKTTPRDIYATALAVMLPISAVSAISYARLGVWHGEGAAVFILPAVAGGIAGALLLDRLNTGLLRLIFSAVAVYSGLTMLMRSLG